MTEKKPAKENTRRPSREEEARQVQEYIDDQRELQRKLRQKERPPQSASALKARS